MKQIICFSWCSTCFDPNRHILYWQTTKTQRFNFILFLKFLINNFNVLGWGGVGEWKYDKGSSEETCLKLQTQKSEWDLSYQQTFHHYTFYEPQKDTFPIWKENNLLVTTNRFHERWKRHIQYLFDQAFLTGSRSSTNPPLCILVSLGQSVSLSLTFVDCLSQSRVSLQPSQEDMAALVRSSSWVNNWVHPKGMPALFMERDLFLYAVTHEGLVLLMQIYLHHLWKCLLANY